MDKTKKSKIKFNILIYKFLDNYNCVIFEAVSITILYTVMLWPGRYDTRYTQFEGYVSPARIVPIVSAQSSIDTLPLIYK
jgi:hypothetical protein